MKRLFCWVVLAGAFAAPAVRAADEKLPSAEAVLDRYIEVTGGKAVYEKRKSEEVVVGLEIAGQGIKGTLTRYADDSDNAYSTGELEGVGKIEEGVYKGQAWESNPMMGPRLKTGEENASAVRDARFHGQLEWRKLYKAEVKALEKVGGEDAYKVVLTPLDGGKPQSVWYGKDTGYMLKMERTIVSPMGEFQMEQSYSDYQQFGSTKGPKKITQNIMGTQIEVTVNSVKENPELPAGRFEPPADVKKLMAK